MMCSYSYTNENVQYSVLALLSYGWQIFLHGFMWTYIIAIDVPFMRADLLTRHHTHQAKSALLCQKRQESVVRITC